MKITDEYLKEQKALHAFHNYGTMGAVYAPLVSQIINKLGVTELLDYGCGRGSLVHNLVVDHPMKIQMYDPAIEDYAGEAVPMQMVTCIDVLEHVEPACLDAVLDDLKRCTDAVGFFTVATGPAEKTLSDGRNAHLIQEGPEFWIPRLMDRFELQTFQMVSGGFYVIVYPYPKPLIEVPQ